VKLLARCNSHVQVTKTWEMPSPLRKLGSISLVRPKESKEKLSLSVRKKKPL